MGAVKVTAPMVTATMENDRVVYLYRGDIVPEGLSKESRAHLSELGFIGKADDAARSADSDDRPAGNASLEDWTGYARTQGASDEDLEGKSRNDLRDQYSD